MEGETESAYTNGDSENYVDQEIPPLTVFELSLDASSDVTGMAIAVQSLSSAVEEIRVDIYNSFTTRWEEEAVPFLFSALGRVPNLLRIEFYGLRIFPYKMPIAMAERTLRHAIHLEEFCLVGLKLSAEGTSQFRTFSESLRRHPSLKAFVLDNCSLDDEVSGPTLDDAVVQMLVQVPTLEKIVFRATEARMWARIKVPSIRLLCSSTTLTSLELTGDNEFFMKEAATSLVRANKHSKLTKLSLSGYLGGSIGARAISDMMFLNTRIERLCLHLRSRCEEDEAGIIDLSHALAKSKTLTRFELSGATSESGSRFTRSAYLQALKKNYSLTERAILFHGSFLLPDSQYYAKLNSVGRGRLLGNFLAGRDEWVDVLIKERHDLDIIYYFLRVQPSLFSCTGHASVKNKRKLSLCDKAITTADQLGRDDDTIEGHRKRRLRHL